jgi:hypothetical protein
MNDIQQIEDESLVYVDKEPDIGALANAYDTCLIDLDYYFESCLRSYNDRRNIWDGKSDDLRKNGANAFPWQGASDQEVNVVGERIDMYVALFDQALARSHIKAFPTSMAAMPKAAVVSGFLKWMRSSYIPDFKRQMELGGNYLMEKGIMVSYVGWNREKRSYLQSISLEQIGEQSPDLVELILSGQDDKMLLDLIQESFPDLSAKRAKKSIKDLRKMGVAEIPLPRQTVDCPVVYACAPDGEVMFPSYISDPQRAPYMFWRTFLTAQELEKKVANEGWDRKWVDNAIETLRGKDSMYLDGEKVKTQTRLQSLTTMTL